MGLGSLSLIQKQSLGLLNPTGKGGPNVKNTSFGMVELVK
jgi:hypothetical protein